MIEKAVLFLGVCESGRRNLVDYYNKHCYPLVRPERKYKMTLTDAWCAMFTSVVAHVCGYHADGFPFEVSCYQQKRIAIQKNWYTQDTQLIKPGDIVMFRWKGRGVVSHTGIVESVEQGVIITIEGNLRGTVGRRSVPHDYQYIDGFIVLQRP